MLRIHSETLCLLALAVDSIARNSPSVTRTQRVPALAFPLGSGGRPAFLRFFCCLKVPELLYDCRLNRRLSP